jgi:dUTP pyrophosphatase
MQEFKYTFDECLTKDERNMCTLAKSNSDAGYDIRAMRIEEKDGFLICDTCIRLEAPPGYYFEVFARSSLSKYGYILANSVGIIDNGYRGNVICKLFKICESDNHIKVGDRICQLIVKKMNDFTPMLSDELSSTERGAGGFGSTGRI